MSLRISRTERILKWATVAFVLHFVADIVFLLLAAFLVYGNV